MKPAPFLYERPDTVDDAVRVLGRYGQRARVLAGGQSLIAMLNLRIAQTECLIDIGRIGALRRIERVGNEYRIGAMTTHSEILDSADVARDLPLMTEAYREVSHRGVRNFGTLGGSLCHNDPAAEMPLVVSLLGATMIARSEAGVREIPERAFFAGIFTTTLRPDEMLAEIRIPIPPAGHGWSFLEVSQRKGDFAIVLAAAMLTLRDGVCRDVRIGYRNVGLDHPRLPAIEAMLEGQAPEPARLGEISAAAAKAVNPPSDIHADEAYRRDLVAALTRRVLSQAASRANR